MVHLRGQPERARVRSIRNGVGRNYSTALNSVVANLDFTLLLDFTTPIFAKITSETTSPDKILDCEQGIGPTMEVYRTTGQDYQAELPPIIKIRSEDRYEARGMILLSPADSCLYISKYSLSRENFPLPLTIWTDCYQNGLPRHLRGVHD